MAVVRRWTEAELLDLLWARLTAGPEWSPPRYVMAEHPRYHPAWGRHIADAISLDTWGSGGYATEGYEIKVSRADWRRELVADRVGGSGYGPNGGYLEPMHDLYAKSWAWRRHCATWWIVAPTGIVKRDELPPGWGLIEPVEYRSGDVLRARVVADTLADPVPLGRAQIAGLMRAVAQTAARRAAK